MPSFSPKPISHTILSTSPLALTLAPPKQTAFETQLFPVWPLQPQVQRVAAQLQHQSRSPRPEISDLEDDNFLASQSREPSTLSGSMLADNAAQNLLTFPVGGEPPPEHPTEQRHDPWPGSESGEFRLNSPHNVQCDTRISPPADVDPQVPGSDVRRVNRSSHPAPNWTSYPDWAQLRRPMGITTDLVIKPRNSNCGAFGAKLAG